MADDLIQMNVHALSSQPADTSMARTLRRAFWVFMIVLHVMFVRSAWASMHLGLEGATLFDAAVRIGGLCLSLLFFLLKLADVAWLRLKPGWRSMLVSLVLVVFVHANVLEQAAQDDWHAAPVKLGAVVGLAAVVAAERCLKQFVRTWATFVRSLGVLLGSGIRPLRPACDFVHARGHHPQPAGPPAAHPLRGPPCC